ncbi:MAG: lipase family protein, partial [Ignavibacteriota bacterium]
VVNSLDAIPEMPISIQTLDDFNEINLFEGARDSIKKNLSFPKDLAALYVYDKLDAPLRDALASYQKYLGSVMATIAHSAGVKFGEPIYANTNNYTRIGEQIILTPDAEYFNKFPQDKTDKLTNHYLQTYLYLAEKYRPKKY